MRQAVHIFKKDVRCLWWLILTVLALTTAFTVFAAKRHVFGTLLVIAWTDLVACLIHEEALPGTRQFWLTRPYSWGSLLAGKALFVLAFVTLPMTIADIVIVTTQGFRIGPHLGGLVWEQLLWWLVFIIPVGALASITVGLVDFVSLALVILVLYTVLERGLARMVLAQRGAPQSPVLSVVVLVLACGAVIVVEQYARRMTTLARIALAGIVVLVAIVPYLPARTVFGLRAASSKTKIAGSSIQITFNPSRTTAVRDGRGRVQIGLAFRMSGVPPGLQLREDSVRASIEGADGPFNFEPEWFFELEPGAVIEIIDIRAGLFDRLRDQPVRIRTTALFTLYGNQRTVALSGGAPAEVPGAGLCEPASHLCRLPFRGPRVLVSTSGFSMQAPYAPPSPYPAELVLDPIVDSPVSEFNRATKALMTEEPIARLRSDFEIGPIRLGDFEKP
jgi:hypothetical protein